ncbi:hypothetical protein Mtc_1111 [Methanocella conradii HZ254]|uniref:Uncharacterized protein n=1 Tax=Methanocella conradii (strain DSM 24694 / JCM 17849 / CGMCC 1.5162 / HZ254) TaxID=1041930 RepID=H8I7N2_METCZ|nr:hypothetical protein Mtc_1111 [Methanocella conradii HZ254]
MKKILCIPVSLVILLAITDVPTMACKPLEPCDQKNLSLADNVEYGKIST